MPDCGAEHPDYVGNGWTCDRPAGHDGPHATRLWEEWSSDYDA